MVENVSDRNGRALEYVVALELEKLSGFKLSNQAVLLNARDKPKFQSLPIELKNSYQKASIKISNWVKILFANHNYVVIDRPNDNPDDPSDFVLKSQTLSISISLKHNHEALKHPRPYSFAQACGFIKGSLSDLDHRKRMSLASRNFRGLAANNSQFSQCSPSVINKLYLEVCKACEDSFNNWLASNNKVVFNLFDFLVSNGFYKVIVDTRSGVSIKVQDYLNIPAPNSCKTSVQGNRLILEFNNNWKLNLRIHTASSRIAPSPSQLSLKFDAQKERGNVNEFTL
jgi:hypothetical protein